MKFLKFSLALMGALVFGAISSQAQNPIPVTYALQATYSHSGQGVTIAINNAYLLGKVFSTLGLTKPAGASLAVNTNGNVVVMVNGAIIMDLSANAGYYYYYAGTNLTSTNIVTKRFPHNVTLSYTNVTYASVFFAPFIFYDPVWSGTFTSNNIFSLTGLALADLDYNDYYDDLAAPKVAPKGGYEDYYTIQFYTYSYTYTYTGETAETGSNEYYDLGGNEKSNLGISFNNNVYSLSFLINASGECYSSTEGETGYASAVISAKGTQQGGESFLDYFNGYFDAGNFYYYY